jgi:hypothetical protein
MAAAFGVVAVIGGESFVECDFSPFPVWNWLQLEGDVDNIYAKMSCWEEDFFFFFFSANRFVTPEN